MYMEAGSAGELGRRHGLEQVGFWRKLLEHPSYDSWWQQQAMDKILAAQPLKVPTMLVDSLWDQEDIYGAPAVYKALKPKDTGNDKVFLVMGPWHHGQEIDDGSSLGALKFGSDTGAIFPPEHSEAISGSIPERWCAEGRRGASNGLRNRNEHLAPFARLACGMRVRMRSPCQAAVSWRRTEAEL